MTYILWPTDFALYLEDYWISYFGIKCQYDLTFDLKINVGLCDLYFMVQWLCLISPRLIHAYQSLACETATNTDFSELFSLKHIYVKYKNAILSLIDCFVHTWKDLVKYFSRYLIITVKLTIKIEPIKYLGKYMPICLILPCAAKAIYMWQNSIFIFYINTFQENNSLNSRDGVHFWLL